MAYMVYQQYTTAVKRAYRGRPDVPDEHARARAFRGWLERLDIDPAIRAELVELALSLERGFEEVGTASDPTERTRTTG
jgi:hypothetical protein